MLSKRVVSAIFVCITWGTLAGCRAHRDADVKQTEAKAAKATASANDDTLPSIEAARSGKLTVLKDVFEHGASSGEVDKNGDTALSVALQQGFLEGAKLCLDQGFNPQTIITNRTNPPQQLGDKPLYLAAKNGDVEIVRRLLHSGARPDSYKPYFEILNGTIIVKDSALAAAVLNDRLEIARLLLENKANTQGLFADGVPILFIPIRTRNLPMLKLLLEFDSKYILPKAGTPIGYAVEKDWPEGVQVLLNAGARWTDADLEENPNAIPNPIIRRSVRQAIIGEHFRSSTQVSEEIQQSAAAIATDFYNASTSESLQRIYAADSPALAAVDDRGWSLLCYAADAGRIEYVRALTAHGLNPNFLTPDEGSLLYLAVRRENRSICEYLVKQGVNLEFCSPGGKTALEEAIVKHNYPLFEWLLSKGAKAEPPEGLVRYKVNGARVYSKDTPGKTPLMFAAENGDEKMVNRLLTAGGNPRAAANLGETPTFFAAIEDHANILKILSRLGVKYDDEIARAGPVMELAISRNLTDYIDRLAKIGVPMPSNALDLANSSETVATIKRTLASGTAKGSADILFWDNIAFKSKEEVAAFLVHGGDPNFPGGETPLQRAVAEGRLDLVELLIAKGAETNRRGMRVQHSIIMHAMYHVHDEATTCRIIQLLVKNGAIVDEGLSYEEGYGQGRIGVTPLMVSIVRGSVKITQTLLDLGASVAAQDLRGRAAIDFLAEANSYTPESLREMKHLLNEAQRNSTKRFPNKSDRSSTNI